MYFPGEALNREPLVEPSDINPGGSPIYVVSGVPGLLARNPTLVRPTPDMLPVDQVLTEALFRLSTYDIEFPGVGGLITREPGNGSSDTGYTYATTHFVDGLNMHADMTEVPLDVTVGTVNNILTYYEDMSNDYSDRLYFTDVSLEQCMYGRASDEAAIDNGLPHANFVDFQRFFNNLKHGVIEQPAKWPGFQGIEKLDNDLRALTENFPDQSFDHIASRLLALGRRLGVFYRLLTAYDMENPQPLAVE